MEASIPTARVPLRSPWCALGIVLLFSLPVATFLLSWYRPYLSDAFRQPAIDPALNLLVVVALPIVIWLRASTARRRRWLWAGLGLIGGLLGFAHPFLGLIGGGLPGLAYAATGLTSRTRQTSKRDTEASWVLIIVGGPLGLFVCWLSFYLSFSSDFRFGPPPFITAQTAYAITVRADLSGLAPEQETASVLGSQKIMLLRLKELSVGVVSARIARDSVTVRLFSTRDQEQTAALVSSQGVLEVVDLGDTPLPAGAKLPLPHTAVVSGLRLRVVDDWRYESRLLVRDVKMAYDRSGNPEALLVFDGDGAKALRDYTSASIGRYMALAVDDVVLSSSKIESPVLDGGLAVGGLSLDEARLLVLKLRFGALAVPFSVVSVTTQVSR